MPMKNLNTQEAHLYRGPYGLEPRASVELESVLLDEVQNGRSLPILRLWINDWCVVLGKNNKPDEWIDVANLEADDVPYFHRDSGGGTVIHHPGNLNYTFIVPKTLLPAVNPTSAIRLFTGVLVRALAYLDIHAERTGVSDVSVDGIKISGNAARFKSRALLHHGTVLLTSELSRMERYLKVPPNRPDIPHRGFVAGLREMGYPVGVERLCESLARAAAETFNWHIVQREVPRPLVEKAKGESLV